MCVVFDAGLAFAVLYGKLYGKRRFGGSLIFVNFDAVAFKRGEKVVDLLRGVHFSGKRIVDFDVKQIAALFANGNERLYRFVFFFKKNLRHKSSRSKRAFSGPSGRPTDRQIAGLLKKSCRHTRWAGRARARFGSFTPVHS